MPAHKLSAKGRAARENLKKATEQRKAKALARFMDKIRQSGVDLEKQIEQIQQRLPDLARDEIIRILEKQPRKDLVTIFKQIPFEVFEAAGGIERWKELVGTGKTRDPKLKARQDALFLELTNMCVALSKSQQEKGPSAQAAVVVRIIGRDDEETTNLTVTCPNQEIP